MSSEQFLAVGRAHPASLFSKLETFRNLRSWAGGPPVNYEKFGRAGVSPATLLRTGWKPVPPIPRNFSEQSLMSLRLSPKG